MRRHTAYRFVVIKVITKLRHIGVVFVFALGQLAFEQPFLPQPFAQGLNQAGVFGPTLAQQIAHTVQHRQSAAEIGPLNGPRGQYKGSRFGMRIERRVCQQHLCQGLQPSFSRDHALGPSLGFEGQIQVFQLLLGRRQLDGGLQIGRQFALLLNAFQHRGTAVFELPQITQSRFEFTQLDVVQPIGHLFAITGNERHGGPPIEQLNSGLHLVWANLDFVGQLGQDFLHVSGISREGKRTSLPQAKRRHARTLTDW